MDWDEGDVERRIKVDVDLYVEDPNGNMFSYKNLVIVVF